MKPGERGAALITVLLLVAIMSALIALSFDRVILSIKRETNRVRSDEARLNFLGAEAVAAARIGNIISSDPNRTDGRWQNQTISVAVPGGSVTARLTDGGNCFNINSMVSAMPNGQLVAQPVTVDQFARLAASLGVPANGAARLANAIADWIDSDSETLPGGAEDSAYQRAVQPYRTPNVMIHDVDDLRRVEGMSAEIFQRISPYLCALPTNGLPAYNINTLTLDKARLVATLFPVAIEPEVIISALRNRPAGGFGSVQDFLSLPPLQGVLGSGTITTQLRVRSDWFTLKMMSELDHTRLNETLLLDGRLSPVRVVRRRYGRT